MSDAVSEKIHDTIVLSFFKWR